MPLILAILNSDARSDQTDRRCAQTAQSNYGSAPPHCESCPPPAGLCPGEARATETLLAVPVPVWAYCHKPHRLAPGASCGDQGTGRKTQPLTDARLRRAGPPPFDSHRSHWLRSRLLLTAWLGRHTRGEAPSRICRDPRGWGRFAHPFFCRLLG